MDRDIAALAFRGELPEVERIEDIRRDYQEPSDEDELEEDEEIGR
jgi:hypothetical protein